MFPELFLAAYPLISYSSLGKEKAKITLYFLVMTRNVSNITSFKSMFFTLWLMC